MYTACYLLVLPLSEDTVVRHDPAVVQSNIFLADARAVRQIVGVFTATINWISIFRASGLLLEIFGKVTPALSIVGSRTTSRLRVRSNTVIPTGAMHIVASN